MKKTELLRSKIPMRRGKGLRRSYFRRKVSAQQQRQVVLRHTAYDVVDARSGLRCELAVDVYETRCSARATSHHHRRRRGAGGSSDAETETPANILAVCLVHHDAIHHRPKLSRSLGLLVDYGNSPAATPVTLWAGPVLLGADGSMTRIDGQ